MASMNEYSIDKPLPWLWSCHHCQALYPLGATRRCLHDGHYFCGGTTVSALTGKTLKRHKACRSEFDYVGWEDVAKWRPSEVDAVSDRKRRRQGCDALCRYPSACHHRQAKSSVQNRSNIRLQQVYDTPFSSASIAKSVLDKMHFGSHTNSTIFSLPSCSDTDVSSLLLSLEVPKCTSLDHSRLTEVTKNAAARPDRPSNSRTDSQSQVAPAETLFTQDSASADRPKRTSSLASRSFDKSTATFVQ